MLKIEAEGGLYPCGMPSRITPSFYLSICTSTYVKLLLGFFIKFYVGKF